MKQKDKLFRFDLIRGLAMLFVIITHFNETLVKLNIYSPCIHVYMGRGLLYSQIGVVLFILMSGSLSAMSLERCLPDDCKMEKRSILNYYKKRILSILPLYYMAYIIAYLIKVVPNGVAVHPAMIWSFLGMDGYLTRFNIPIVYLVGEWFIGMIIICYLLCPFLYQAIRKYPKITFFILLIYYILIVTYYPFMRNKETDVLVRIFDFAVGMYFGIYIKRVPRAVVAICLAVSVLFCFVEPNIDYIYLIIIRGVSLYCVLWFLGDYFQTFQAKIVVKVRNACSTWAKYSFAIYMIHKLVIDEVLYPFAGGSADLKKYVRLMTYSGVLMVALGVILFSAEKYIMQSLIRKK